VQYDTDVALAPSKYMQLEDGKPHWLAKDSRRQ